MCILFTSCARTTPENNSSAENVQKTEHPSFTGYIKAVWLSYKELSEMISGADEKEFTKRTDEMLDNVKSLSLNTVIVHARAFSDAFYDSDIFPWSKYVSGTEGTGAGYDPFGIICREAKEKGIYIEAWINPYRVSSSTDFSLLSDKNPAKNLQGTRRLIVCEKGIFYNPASVENQLLIIDGVREITEKYSVCAVHLDDYFYPSADEGIDEDDFSQYVSDGGKLSLGDWRRENVNSLISGIYSAVKAVSNDIQVVISPAADIQKNYDIQYADIKKWVHDGNYVDIIMPQLYFGFNNSAKPFEKTLAEWKAVTDNTKTALVVGLAFYKCGKEDLNAGEAKNEWIENDNIISRQVSIIMSDSTIYGYAFFSYNYIFGKNLTENAKNELQTLKSMLY